MEKSQIKGITHDNIHKSEDIVIASDSKTIRMNII